jgi:hypothetical protein
VYCQSVVRDVQTRKVESFLGRRPLLSAEARDADFISAMNVIRGGDMGKAGILSLTFGRQGKDLQPTAVSGFTGLLKRLNENNIVTEGAAATERGGKHHWYHMQAMLWCPKLNPSRQEVQEACATLVYNFAGIPKGQNYHVYAELHWPDEQPHISWKSMVGCVLSYSNCSCESQCQRVTYCNGSLSLQICDEGQRL